MDIKLWYALNSNEKVVRIADAKKGEEYFCPCCGAEVLPRALNSEKIRPHFYHKKGESCSEEEIHKWVKKDLFKVGQSIKVNTCKGIKEYIIKDILIEKTYKTSVGDYRPDISLVTTDGSVIFVEVCNNNKKSIERYFDKWFELGNTVIEIKAKEVIENNFNLDILEPIYDDDDRFRHFNGWDYRKLFGDIDESSKRKAERIRENLKRIYNIMYDLKHNKTDIRNALYRLSWVYREYDAYGLYKIIDKYVCKCCKDIFFEKYKNYVGVLLDSLNKEFGTHYNINPLENKKIEIGYHEYKNNIDFRLYDTYASIVAQHRNYCLRKRIDEKIKNDEEYQHIEKELDFICGLSWRIEENDKTIQSIKRINKYKLDDIQINALIKPLKDINDFYRQKLETEEDLKNKKKEIIERYYTDKNDDEISKLIELANGGYDFKIDSEQVKKIYTDLVLKDSSIEFVNFLFRNIEYEIIRKVYEYGR